MKDLEKELAQVRAELAAARAENVCFRDVLETIRRNGENPLRWQWDCVLAKDALDVTPETAKIEAVLEAAEHIHHFSHNDDAQWVSKFIAAVSALRGEGQKTKKYTCDICDWSGDRLRKIETEDEETETLECPSCGALKPFVSFYSPPCARKDRKMNCDKAGPGKGRCDMCNSGRPDLCRYVNTVGAMKEIDTLRQQLSEVERERDAWKVRFKTLNKELMCELRDPCGTIWDHAKTLQNTVDAERAAYKYQFDRAEKAEAEKEAIWQWVENEAGKAFDAGMAFATGSHKTMTQTHPSKQEYIADRLAEKEKS